MMHEEERNLDRHIENMRKSMQVLLEDPAHKGNLYIAEDDIKVIPCFASETLVAVRARRTARRWKCPTPTRVATAATRSGTRFS